MRSLYLDYPEQWSSKAASTEETTSTKVTPRSNSPQELYKTFNFRYYAKPQIYYYLNPNISNFLKPAGSSNTLNSTYSLLKMFPCPAPYSKPTFHYGRPIPNSPFEKWLRQESKRAPGEPQPRPLKLSTNWLDGTESIPNLLLSSHSPIDLSSTLQNFISRRGTQLNSSQRIGIESYLSQRKTGHFGIISLPEDREAIMRYYDYFNDIIFCGSLEGLCAIRFCRDSDHHGMGPDDLGAAITPTTGLTHRAQIPDGYAALIKIKDRSGESPHVDEETRRTSYLSTLLHEMLHVFFGVYVCLCSNACRRRHADEIGRDGHRRSWQLAALAVEEASVPLLGEAVDLSRRISFEEDEEYVENVDVETRVRLKFED